ncbi:MAG: biopolymer transporter ExbD [Spirochaetaceae bacterium]|jgi:biopolymer transport protein ExbD|nr:biopolymer transporter ExbD [Spirochaetaceae bacterium]
MKISRDRKDFTVPLNSMSDVAFLLLIFIMLVSLINYRKEVHIDYPVGEASQKTSAEKNLEIWIDKTGNVYLDGDSATFSEVEAAVKTFSMDAPDTRIHFIVDRDTPFMFVNSGLDILKQFQYRSVSLVVKDAAQ